MTRGILIPALLLVFPGDVLPVEEAFKAGDSQEEWKLATNSGDVALYTRVRNGSKLKEFKAVGEIDA
jgi:hypothetical protein